MDRSLPILSCVTANSIQIVFYLASTDLMDSVNSGEIISQIYSGNVRDQIGTLSQVGTSSCMAYAM